MNSRHSEHATRMASSSQGNRSRLPGRGVSRGMFNAFLDMAGDVLPGRSDGPAASTDSTREQMRLDHARMRSGCGTPEADHGRERARVRAQHEASQAQRAEDRARLRAAYFTFGHALAPAGREGIVNSHQKVRGGEGLNSVDVLLKRGDERRTKIKTKYRARERPRSWTISKNKDQGTTEVAQDLSTLAGHVESLNISAPSLPTVQPSLRLGSDDPDSSSHSLVSEHDARPQYLPNGLECKNGDNDRRIRFVEPGLKYSDFKRWRRSIDEPGSEHESVPWRPPRRDQSQRRKKSRRGSAKREHVRCVLERERKAEQERQSQANQQPSGRQPRKLEEGAVIKSSLGPGW